MKRGFITRAEQLTNRFASLPIAVRVSLAACVIASLISMAQSARMLSSVIAPARLPEYERRLQGWSRAYGFATSCEPKLVPQTRIVLVNPVVGPGEAAPVILDFDPDTSHFAYPLSPRVVTVQWDLSSPWLPHDGETDYVAFWDPGPDRSTAQRTAAVTEAQLLSARFLSSVVCSYEDQQGDRGTIYAASSRAINGIAVPSVDSTTSSPLPHPYGSMPTMLRVLLAIASLWFLGALLIAVLVRRELPTSLVAALAFPVGCLVAVVELTVFSVLGVPWSGWALAAPFLILGLAWVVTPRPWTTQLMKAFALGAGVYPRPAASTAERLIVVALLALGVCLLALAPLGLPVLDGFSAGYFKAHVFWTDGSLLPFYQNAHSLFYAQPTHPPFVALIVNWLYLFAGGVDEHATLMLWPVLLCALLGVFYALLRSISSVRIALWSTLLTALSAYDLTGAAMQYGYADLPLALFLLGGVGVLWLSVVRPDLPWQLQLIGGMLLAGAAWTKEEGIVGGPVALLAVAVLARRASSGQTGRPWWLPPAVAGAACAITIVPLLFLRFSFPAPEVIVHATGLSNAGSRLPVIVIGFALRSIQHWYLPIVLAALALWQLRLRHLAWRSLQAAGVWFLLAVVVAQLGADTAAVAVNTFEVNAELALAAGRLLLQLSPLVFLAALAVCVLPLQHDAASPASGRVARATASTAQASPGLPSSAHSAPAAHAADAQRIL